MDNKFPGKDITFDDIKTKFPLCAKKNKNHFSKFKVAGVEFGGKKIPVMAGPNMVENNRMICKTAAYIKKNGASFLRGGAYKPLTFPYRSKSYYETREKGIEWLLDAKKKFNIPIITEILDVRDIESICKVTDIIQIGSRNMQNFPLITECAKTKKPIMLKRHFGASLRDWLGAAEYVLVEGNTKLMLCERGVSVPHTHRSTSRFLLDLQIIPAIKEICHLPVIVDPSHATFWRPWVKDMTLASIAAGADGIMLEVHPDPENSAVDPLQPISFKSFSTLIKQMKKVAKSIGRKI
jgi:3-deoxy-7-phosphoheptulonate synthase